jgi:hypothetical protein
MKTKQSFERPDLSRVTRTALVLGCTALLAAAVAADATPARDFASAVVGPTEYDEIGIKLHTDILKVKMKTEGFADVYNVTNTVKPLGHSGWHTHPGPSLVTVSKGTAVYYDGDDPGCTPHVVHQGEGFVDQGDGHVHLVRNPSATDNLELIAFQIIPEGAQRRIDAADPGFCPAF